VSPQYAGMPEDRANFETDDCGCEWVRVALPGNPWARLRRCEQHEEQR
jgi:hypothetical protein